MTTVCTFANLHSLIGSMSADCQDLLYGALVNGLPVNYDESCRCYLQLASSQVDQIDCVLVNGRTVREEYQRCSQPRPPSSPPTTPPPTPPPGVLAQWASSASASSRYGTGDSYSPSQATGPSLSFSTCATRSTAWTPATGSANPEWLL
eukprot:5894742-Prymnesium_polylepis.1